MHKEYLETAAFHAAQQRILLGHTLKVCEQLKRDCKEQEEEVGRLDQAIQEREEELALLDLEIAALKGED